MEDEVVNYFNVWEQSVEERPEERCQKQRMFLSTATYKGVLMTSGVARWEQGKR